MLVGGMTRAIKSIKKESKWGNLKVIYVKMEVNYYRKRGGIVINPEKEKIR